VLHDVALAAAERAAPGLYLDIANTAALLLHSNLVMIGHIRWAFAWKPRTGVLLSTSRPPR
jgi:hypothetical protein